MRALAKFAIRRAPRRRLWLSVGLTAALIAGWLATPVSPHVDSSRSAIVAMKPGEDVKSAMLRAGASVKEAAAVSGLLKEAQAAGEFGQGAALRVVFGSMAGEDPRLASLRIVGRDGRPFLIDRAYDGDLRLGGGGDHGHVVVTVAEEKIQGSLFDTAERVGADPALVGRGMALLAARLDFSRDIRPGDWLRLVFTRKTDADGDTLETGDLLYAEVGDLRLYAFGRDGHTEFLDAMGRSSSAPLLRTPVTEARLTSAFGMRHHPILGYSRLHQGVDFAAPLGTPVLAAGDGVVVEARPWQGYGNWLRIRHAGGWQTGYAHLAAYVGGVGPGVRVRQGEVVGYVGQTGLATGPHLHYEVWLDGVRVDPMRAVSAPAADLGPVAAAEFARQRARIDELLTLADGRVPKSLASAPAAAVRYGELRLSRL
jgi:murein DD-endopeptidase MepM/ murein hydrolase activator NlpD